MIMRRQPQSEIVLNHMRKYGSINSLEAIRRYGITRISAAIYRLRQAGFVISSVADNPAAPLFVTYRIEQEATKRRKLQELAAEASAELGKAVAKPETVPSLLTDYAIRSNRIVNSVNK